MKFIAAGLIIASSALVTGCAVYPDGSPAYATGGYSSYAAYPPGYEPGYGYGAPVVQSGVIVGGGGGYYGGPGPRYWDDGPGYRRPPPGGWGDRGGYRGGDRGGDRGNHGGNGNHGGGRGGPPPQAGGPQPGGQQGGRPPQASNPGQPVAAPAPQARGSAPYIGRANWGKAPAQPVERNH